MINNVKMFHIRKPLRGKGHDPARCLHQFSYPRIEPQIASLISVSLGEPCLNAVEVCLLYPTLDGRTSETDDVSNKKTAARSPTPVLDASTAASTPSSNPSSSFDFQENSSILGKQLKIKRSVSVDPMAVKEAAPTKRQKVGRGADKGGWM